MSIPPTLERVREVLHYNRSTGVFLWRTTRRRATAGKRAGTITSLGYRRISLDGRMYLAGMLAWLYVKGEWPANEIDHKDRNPSNDVWKNLRLATRKQNCENNGVRKDSSTGIRGVHFFKRTGQWTAYINHNGKRQHLGYFGCITEAAAARAGAERKIWTHSPLLMGN